MCGCGGGPVTKSRHMTVRMYGGSTPQLTVDDTSDKMCTSCAVDKLADVATGAVGGTIAGAACSAAVSATGFLAWLAPLAGLVCGAIGSAIEDAATGGAHPRDFTEQKRSSIQLLLDGAERGDMASLLRVLIDDEVLRKAVFGWIAADAVTIGPKTRAAIARLNAAQSEMQNTTNVVKSGAKRTLKKAVMW